MARKAVTGEQGRSMARPRTSARRAMTPRDIERIREIVRNWPAQPFTWELVRAKVARDIQQVGASGRRHGSDAAGWSRQALAKHEPIKEAYATRRGELRLEENRNKKNPLRNRDPEVVVLRRQRDGLRIKINELETKLSTYEERYQTVLYNLALGAATEIDLLRPLIPKIDRLNRT